MKSWKQVFSVALVLTFITAAAPFAPQARKRMAKQTMTAADPALARKIRRFAPTMLTADTSRLALNDRKALQKIIAAAKFLDPLYMRQVWNGNEALLKK